MSNSLKNLLAAAPSSGLQFRARPYGDEGVREFLRDVIAMANAAVDGPRHIVIGMSHSATNGKTLHTIDNDPATARSQELVSEYIEPAIQIKYHLLSFEGKRIGVYQIEYCAESPYMMRIDHSETLRRGDAWVRTNDNFIKLGRQQLQAMFEKYFRDSVGAEHVEIGFPGEIIHKSLQLTAVDLHKLPSRVATTKLRELLKIQETSQDSGSTTVMARLTHARLFGTDNPYEDKSAEELQIEMAATAHKYHQEDAIFLFEEHGTELQIVVINQGANLIEDATLALTMPQHEALYVADKLPPLLRDRKFVDRPATASNGYPGVTTRNDAIHVSCKVGDLPPATPIDAFAVPLRICIGKSLEGRKVGIHYSLFGRNLRKPVTGKLKLLV